MTSDQLAQSLRPIADRARIHIIANGEKSMVIELTRDRVEDIRMAADALDGLCSGIEWPSIDKA